MSSPLPLARATSLGRHVDAPEVAARYTLNDLYSAVWLSEAVGAAIRLDLPEAVGDAWTASDDVARDKALNAGALYRVLRALAANGIFEEGESRRFRHTPLSRQLRADHPYSYRPMARLWTEPVVRRSWERLPDAMRNADSGIFNATGRTLYDYLHSDARVADVFNGAMVSNSAHASESVACALDLQGKKRVLDLGGGVGTLTAAIAHAHPHVECALFELPYLAAAAKSYLETTRVRFVPGDFFERVPDGYDLYVIKNTAWNFKDEQALRMMRCVRAAVGGSAARFTIVEYVVREANAPWTTLFDLQMMNLPGGRARTLPEYQALLKDAGFAIERVETVEDQTLVTAAPR